MSCSSVNLDLFLRLGAEGFFLHVLGESSSKFKAMLGLHG